MDRLSDYAREAVEGFRDRLNPNARRVERNWAAIERRAREEVEAPVDLRGAPTRTRRWVTAGLCLVVAAVVLVAALPLLRSWSASASRDAKRLDAAVYERGEALEPQAWTRSCRSGSTACERLPMPLPPDPVSSAGEEAHARVDALPVEDSLSQAPPASAREQKRRRVRALSDPPAEAADRLLVETAVIRRARTALRDGDPARALTALDGYARQFGEGHFGEEAVVLRVAALCRIGRREAGEQLARRFLAAHGDSPLAGQAAKACSVANGSSRTKRKDHDSRPPLP